LASGVQVDLYTAVDLARRLVSAEREASPPTSEEPLVWRDLCKDVLPDWYDDWLDGERARFLQLRLHALESLCRRLAELGRFAEAVEAGQAAVAADPLRESARRVVIATHLAEGNRADALRQYREFQVLCRRELGCEPSEQMMTLMTSFHQAPNGSP
jgi:DNA-binding SARP family transcriptional activator